VLLATICLDRRDFKGALAELARGGLTAGPLLDPVIAKYEEILAQVPNDIEARAGFIEALLQGRRYDRVLAAGAETLKLRDDESTACVSVAMGDALREKGDTDSAVKRYFAAHGKNRSLASGIIERLKNMIGSEGTHPLAALALGKVLGSEGRCPEAVEALGAARTADPKLSDAVLGELQRLRDTFPGVPEISLGMLQILAESSDHKRSLQVISDLLDLRPDMASVLAGHLDRILKADPQQAFATFEMGRALQLLKLAPRSSATYLSAFRMDATLGPMVLKHLNELIEAAPTCPDPYVAACAVYVARGKLQAAAQKIEQALEKLPGEVERLLPRLEEVQKQTKASGSISLILADACLRAGRHDRALAAYGEAGRRDSALVERALKGVEAILEAAPKMAEAHLWRARFRSHRMQFDEALVDLHQAAQLQPELWPAVVEEAESIRARSPESHACALLLADHHSASGKEGEAVQILTEQLVKAAGRSERLAILVRLWRLASTRGDDEEARQHLAEASKLAPDKNQFLLKVHETQIQVMRAAAARLRGTRRGADLQRMLRLLVDLGEVRDASALLDRHATQMEPKEVQHLRADIALRSGEHARAAEHLARLGASRALAFAAARSGDYALAARTLETLAAKNPEPGLDVSLARVYRDMVAADLMGGRRRLVGETTINFNAGAS
ncbi:MAG TPA: hypothetical protein VKF61_05505, partial [Candidatus Polarisedimenticolia bacterium]|nr:hypothetical protein [Candidatus Polarisedimenticolia bacterium]